MEGELDALLLHRIREAARKGGGSDGEPIPSFDDEVEIVPRGADHSSSFRLFFLVLAERVKDEPWKAHCAAGAMCLWRDEHHALFRFLNRLRDPGGLLL
jgi:hypothetical protein